MPPPTATLFVPYTALDDVHQRGTRAAQPPASAVVPGTLYAVTDESNALERSDGTSWASYAPTGGGGGTVAAHAPTHQAGGTDALTYLDCPQLTPAAPAAAVGRLHVTNDSGFSLPAMLDALGIPLYLTRDNVIIAKVTGAALARGQIVYVSGASGANTEVQGARADVAATTPAIGWTLDAGAINAFVRVLTAGVIGNLDTSTVTEGTRLYLSATTAGAWTSTAPSYPAYAQRVGVVTRSHATQGQILVVIAAMAWTTHAPTHEAGGSDPIPLDTLAAPTDVTTLNASASAHGLLRKLSGTATQYLDGSGAWSTPTGTTPAAHHTTHETGGSDALAALDGSMLTTGTVADARLSANVPLKNTGNTFTQVQTITAAPPALILIDTAQPANLRRFQIADQAQVLLFDATDDTGLMVARVSMTRAGDLAVSRDISEKGRGTPMGHWIAQPISAGNFGCDGGTWTITTNYYNSYCLIGKTLFWNLWVVGTVSALSNVLYLVAPGGVSPAVNGGILPVTYLFDATGEHTGLIYCDSATRFTLRRTSPTGTLAAGTVGVGFAIAVQIA